MTSYWRVGLLILTLLVIPTLIFAQMIDWVEAYQTEGNFSGISAIATDNLGNVYHAGIFGGSIEIGNQTLSSTGDIDSYLVKYDNDGNFIWVRHLSGNQNQGIFSIVITDNNNVLVTGYFQVQLSIDGFTLQKSPDYLDFADTFLLEFNTSGNVVMVKNVGFYEDNMADSGADMIVDETGNIYIAGGTGTAMFFKKLNSNGDVLWNKTHGYSSNVGSIHGNAITADRFGNVYAAGFIGSTERGLLLKYNSDGTLIWSQEFHGTVNNLEVGLNDAVIISGDAFGATIIGNQSLSKSGFLGVLNADGNFIWYSSISGLSAASFSRNPKDDLIYFTGTISKNAAFGSIVKNVEGATDNIVGAVTHNGFFSWVTKIGQKNGGPSDVIATNTLGDVFLSNKVQKDSIGVFQCQQKVALSERDMYVVKITPFEKVIIDGPTDLCPGGQGLFSYSPISAYIEHKWKIDANLSYAILDNAHASVDATSPGIFAIEVETSADLSCETFYVNHSIPLIVNALIQKPVIAGFNKVCAGEKNVKFTVAEGPGNFSTSWQLPAHATIVTASPTDVVIDFQDSFLNDNISYTRIGNCNTISSDPFAIETMPLPDATGEIDGENLICAGTGNHIYTIESVKNASEYRWIYTFDSNANTETRTTNTFTLTTPEYITSASIAVTAYNNCGSSTSPVFPINIKHKPDAPTHIDGPDEVCASEVVHIEITNQYVVDAFHWTVRDTYGTIISEISTNEPSINLMLAESLRVFVVNQNNCGDSNPITININQIKDPVITPEITRHCDLLSYSGNETLYWFRDDELLSTNKTIKANREGVYTLKFVGRCNSAETSLSIEQNDIVDFVPNVITPNLDGKNDFFEVSKSLIGSSLLVLNRHGKQIYISNNYNNTWDAPNLATGVYFYVIKSNCSGEKLNGTISLLR